MGSPREPNSTDLDRLADRFSLTATGQALWTAYERALA
jgi:hypothetical protein